MCGVYACRVIPGSDQVSRFNYVDSLWNFLSILAPTVMAVIDKADFFTAVLAAGWRGPTFRRCMFLIAIRDYLYAAFYRLEHPVIEIIDSPKSGGRDQDPDGDKDRACPQLVSNVGRVVPKGVGFGFSTVI